MFLLRKQLIQPVVVREIHTSVFVLVGPGLTNRPAEVQGIPVVFLCPADLMSMLGIRITWVDSADGVQPIGVVRDVASRQQKCIALSELSKLLLSASQSVI